MSFQDRLTTSVQDKVRRRLEERRLAEERARAEVAQVSGGTSRSVPPEGAQTEVAPSVGSGALTPIPAPAGLGSGVVSSPTTPVGRGSGVAGTPAGTPTATGDASQQFLEELRATEGSPQIPLRRLKRRSAEASGSRDTQSKRSRSSQVPEGTFIQLVDEDEAVDVGGSVAPQPSQIVRRATPPGPTFGRSTSSPRPAMVGSSRSVFPEINPATLPEVTKYWAGNAQTLGFPTPPPATSEGPVSLQFPGTCLETTVKTASQVLTGLNRVEDWEKLRSFQTWSLHQKACQLEMQALAYRNTLAVRAMASDAWQNQVRALEANVQKVTEERAARAAEVAQLDKEKEAILANLQVAASACEQHQQDLANARADNARLLADKNSLEARVRDLENIVVQNHAERRHQLDQARAAGYESGLAEGRSLGKREAGDEHFNQGVALCRSQILMSPPGQKFFEVLLEGLPDAFLHSHLFRQKFFPHLSDMAEEMLFGISDQLGASERVKDVNLAQVVAEVMSKAPAVDPGHGENFPWYLDTLKAAANVFRGHREPNAPPVEYPAQGQIDYPVHRANNSGQQNLQLAFEATAVRVLRREVDRALILRGQDPEEVLKEAEVLDEEPEGPAPGEVAPIAPGPTPGPAELPAGVGIFRVEPEVAFPVRPIIPAGEGSSAGPAEGGSPEGGNEALEGEEEEPGVEAGVEDEPPHV